MRTTLHFRNELIMMTQGIVLREATVDDVPIILHHRRSMFEEMGYTDPARLETVVEMSRKVLTDGIRDGSYRAWMAATKEAKVVAGGGIIIVRWPTVPFDALPRRATILNMYTEPGYRRQGLARQLMTIMVDWCKREGFAYVSLHASDEGRQLYEKMGFKPTNDMRLMLK